MDNEFSEQTNLQFCGGLYNNLVAAITKLDDVKTRELPANFLLHFSSDLGHVFTSIHSECGETNANFDCISKFLVNINLAKMFFELIAKCDRSLLPQLVDSFQIMSGNGSVLRSLLSYRTADRCLDFAVTEAVAFYLIACHKFSCCRDGYKVLRDVLFMSDADDRFTMRLLVVERLCELHRSDSCEAFDDFITGKEGVISSGLFACATHSIEHTLRIFRVWTRLLETESGEGVFYEQIEQFLIGHQVYVKKDISRFQYIKLLNSAFSVDVASGNNHDLISTAASRVIVTFLDDAEVWKRKNTSRCFGGRSCDNDSNVEAIVFVNLVLKLVLLAKESEENETKYATLKQLKTFVTCEGDEMSQATSTEALLSKKLISLFIEQDDELVDFLLLQLQLHRSLSRSLTSTELVEFCIIHPHHLFFDLLEGIAYDSSVLLDWLVSNETQFLQYFVKYLKLVIATWEDFAKIATSGVSSQIEAAAGFTEQSGRKLDLTTVTLQKLKISICKLVKAGLFPYAPKPLIKLLDAIESKSNIGNVS